MVKNALMYVYVNHIVHVGQIVIVELKIIYHKKIKIIII